jgi:Ca2+-transporting ATPase
VAPENPTEDAFAWHAAPAEAVLEKLGASPRGLDPSESARRLEAHGRNEIAQRREAGPIRILLSQFKSFLIWLLLAAAAVSVWLGEWRDTWAIFAIVILNAVIGFVQEYRAEKALAALRKMAAPHARVRRGGSEAVAPAAGIVPGDVVILEPGDLVPADARILEAGELRTVEAALTGESSPSEKQTGPIPAETAVADRSNMVYLGTAVAAGSAVAVVVATGMRTELGRIAGLLEHVEDRTPLQKKLRALAKVLAVGSLGIVLLVFLAGFARGTALLDLLLTSVSLAVAAVPEGLPAVVTIALAVGVRRMARKGSLIRRLQAVETLGETTVICADKTGTLTTGQMSVRTIVAGEATFEVTGESYGPDGAIAAPDGGHDSDLERALRGFVGANAASLAKSDGKWVAVGDPTEAALLGAGLKRGLDVEKLDAEAPVERRLPFSSERKRMTYVRKLPDGRRLALMKGAPDVVLSRSTRMVSAGGVRPLDEQARRWLEDRNADLSKGGQRVLAAAFREFAPGEPLPADVETGMVFAGLAGLHDPLRPTAAEAVARCRMAGIRVVMITGDQAPTALAIAREIGLTGGDGSALTGADVARMPDEELRRRVSVTSVYARVDPEHKLRIVRAWKAEGAIVAMTGDGVNDAPALEGADVGIAMGTTGTEVAKEAADMVIVDDDFATIVAAVEQGRGVYDNIKKTLQYLLAGNVGELSLMAAASVAGLPIPLLPIHLLWINLVTDGLPALCLAVDPIDADVMKRPPRPAGEKIVDRSFLATVIGTGLVTATVALVAYVHALGTWTTEVARAHAFGVLVFAELLKAFAMRSPARTLFEVGVTSNLRLLVVVAFTFGIQLLAYQVPFIAGFLRIPDMPWHHVLVLLALGAIPATLIEVRKIVARKLPSGSPRKPASAS